MYEFVIMVVVLPLVVNSIFVGKLIFHNFLLDQNLGWIAYLVVTTVYCVQEYFVLELSLKTIGYVYFQYAIAVSLFFLGRKWLGYLLLGLTPLLVALFFYINELIPVVQIGKCLVEIGLLLSICFLLKRYLRSRIGLGMAVILLTSCMPLSEQLIYGIKFETNWSTLGLLCLGTGVVVSLEFVYQNYLTAQQQKYAQIEYSSTHDELTGLLNYAAFSKQLENLKLDDDLPVVICTLDLDLFKHINDTYGHLEGNNVLHYFGGFLIKNCCEYFGENTKIYRFGGEEFCVLIYGQSANYCLKQFSKIEQTLEQEGFITESGQKINLSFSGGIAQVKKHTNLHTAIRKADSLLYTAKMQGRARVRLDV